MAPRIVTSAEEDIVRRVLKIFFELTIYRNVFAGQWEEAAALVDTDSRNTFYYGSYNFPGMKKTQMQVDATTALVVQQFIAIAISMVTPRNRLWHGLESPDPYVMKDPATQKYFEDLRAILFNYRYRSSANFEAQNYRKWKSTGVYGNSVVYVDELDRRGLRGEPAGLRYRACPLGECFFAENHQGIVNIMIRWFRMTAQQAVERFGEEWLPPNLRPALEQNMQTPYQFLHCVMPRDPNEYDPARLDEKGMPFSSHYVSMEGKCLMAPESGYRTFPYAVSRYEQMPNEVYGRGFIQLGLPAIKTLNAEKAIFLKTGHRASDPTYLTRDDGLVGFDQTPGALNPGSVNPDGKPLVLTLPVGEIQITKEMMAEERGLIENFGLTSLFKHFMDNPNMKATQVVELLNERGMLVAPVLGREHAEYVSGLVPREVDLLSRMRDQRGKPILPQMPPRLKEAMGHYEVKDTSPLALQARGMSRQAAFIRWVDTLRQVSVDTQNPAVMDRVNFDNASQDIAADSDLPIGWVNDDKQMAKQREDRAKTQQQQLQVQAMPAQAAMIKANAIAQQKAPGLAQQAQPQGIPA